jgi:intergrase/recombinase
MYENLARDTRGQLAEFKFYAMRTGRLPELTSSELRIYQETKKGNSIVDKATESIIELLTKNEILSRQEIHEKIRKTVKIGESNIDLALYTLGRDNMITSDRKGMKRMYWLPKDKE